MSRKVLLVTGGSRGIGAATCLLAARAGYAVAVNYRSDQSAAQRVVDSILSLGGEAVAIPADVARVEDIVRLFDITESALGKISAFVNNAGITGKSSRLDEAAEQTIVDTIQLNVVGAIFAAREAVKRMSRRYGGVGGVIVNVSSAAASIGSPGEYTWYAASKGAIDSLTIGLGREVAEDGIRVVGVAPGLTDTEIHARSTGDPGRIERVSPVVPLKRPGTAEEIAKTILFALSDDASYLTATVLRVAGGR